MKDKIKEVLNNHYHEIGGIDKLARQIDSLFPKAGEDGLLTDDYIFTLWKPIPKDCISMDSTEKYIDNKDICKAQKALTDQEWRDDIAENALLTTTDKHHGFLITDEHWGKIVSRITEGK